MDESLPINDLIFKELIKRGYSLDGKTRIWDLGDSKLWYLKPEQAQGYLDLIETDIYKQRFIDKEDALIDEQMQDVLDEVGNEPINLVDLGCGDGTRAMGYIKQLSKNAKIRYCPIDISAYMVNKAIKNISVLDNVKEVVEFHWNISDFDNTENILNILRQGEYKKNVILFLGGTLGNSEFHDLIYQIHIGMKPGDVLVIGNFLWTKKLETDLREGGVQPEHSDWLIQVPMQLGLAREDVQVNRRINGTRSEIYYTILKDHKLEFGGRVVRFMKGDQIIVLVGYLYPKDTFKSFLAMYFDHVDVALAPDGAYALAICKK